MAQDFIGLSKSCSFLLRHGAVKQGLQISKDGWVKATDLLNHINRNYRNDPWTFEHLKQ